MSLGLSGRGSARANICSSVSISVMIFSASNWVYSNFYILDARSQAATLYYLREGRFLSSIIVVQRNQTTSTLSDFVERFCFRTEVLVPLFNPVFARRIEDIEINGVFQCQCFVWQIRRNA